MENKNSETERIGLTLAQLKFEKLGIAFREQPLIDVGIDAQIEFKEDGRFTGKILGIQVKAGTSYFKEETSDYIIFRPSNKNNGDYWLNFCLPVILCLVDIEKELIYWEFINSDTIIKTKNSWKIEVPKNQTLSEASLKKLTEAVTAICTVESHEILSNKDASIAVACRRQLEIMIHGDYSKRRVSQVLRNVVAEARNSEYFRSEITKKAHQNSELSVICFWVFSTLGGHKERSYICRGQWISPSLDPAYSPVQWPGEEIGGGTIVDWKPSPIPTLKSRQSLNQKAVFFDAAKPLIEKINYWSDLYKKNHFDTGNDSQTILSVKEKFKNEFPEIESVHEKIIRLPAAPYEAFDLKELMVNTITLLDNARCLLLGSHFSGLPAKIRLHELRKIFEWLETERTKLGYELRKVE